jgi:hypothetical protein
MSSIPPNLVTSIAQAQLTQQQRAAETDAPRDAAARKAVERQRRAAESREFVEDLAAAAGLKVDADEHRQPGRRRQPPSPPPDADDTLEVTPEPQAVAPSEPPLPPSQNDVRSRSAALLATPDDEAKPTPPPFMLDIEA